MPNKKKNKSTALMLNAKSNLDCIQTACSFWRDLPSTGIKNCKIRVSMAEKIYCSKELGNLEVSLASH